MPCFAETLLSPEPAITLEITPPRKRLPDVLARRARLLGPAAHAVNVIQRVGRLSSLDASVELRAAGRDPVWHLANRGQCRAEIASAIESAAAGGIGMVLCLRGDHEADDAPDTPKIREVVAQVRDAIPGVLIGVTANQYGPPDRVLRNLIPKLEAGADFVQTQPVLELAPLRALRDRAERAGVRPHWVPMVMPLTDAGAAGRIAARLEIPIPEPLRRAIEARRGFAAFAEIVGSLRADDVSGLAIMTPEMDPAPATGARIARLLEEPGESRARH